VKGHPTARRERINPKCRAPVVQARRTAARRPKSPWQGALAGDRSKTPANQKSSLHTGQPQCKSWVNGVRRNTVTLVGVCNLGNVRTCLQRLKYGEAKQAVMTKYRRALAGWACLIVLLSGGHVCPAQASKEASPAPIPPLILTAKKVSSPTVEETNLFLTRLNTAADLIACTTSFMRP